MVTIAIVIAVVIIVIAAGAVMLINNNNSDAKTFAPGTTFSYDVNGTYTYSGYEFVLTGTIEHNLVSQNDKEYFFNDKMVVDMTYNAETTNIIDQENVDMLNKVNMVSLDAVKIGTADINTIDGKKTVDVWQETDADTGAVGTDYIGSDNKILYKSTMQMQLDESGIIEITSVLSDSELKWQTSYKESSSIGTTYNYNVTGDITNHSDSNITGSCTYKCVGEGSNQYCFQVDTELEVTIDGQSNTETDTNYTLSDYISGLNESAVMTGTIEMETIDGKLTLNVWEDLNEDSTETYYVSQNGDVIYWGSASVSSDTYELNIVMTLTSRS